MKLSDRTLQILKNFSTINPSLIFSTNGTIETIAPTKYIMARANIEEKFEQEWCIYDLSRFLSSLSIFKEPDLEFHDHYVTIREGQTKVLNYVFCDRSILENTLRKSKLVIADTVVNFEMPMSAFKETMKAINILKIPDLYFIGSEGKISITGKNSSMKESSDVYSTIIGDTDVDFSVRFKVENLKLMDEEKYDVSVSSKIACIFKSNDIEYIVAMESN